MSIFGKVGHILAFPFVQLGKALFGKAGLRALGTAVKELLKTELGQIAWSAVQAAQGLADKSLRKEQAFNQIRDSVRKNGLDVKDSVINLAIELLVQHLKDKVGEPEEN